MDTKKRVLESYIAEFNIFIRELNNFHPTEGTNVYIKKMNDSSKLIKIVLDAGSVLLSHKTRIASEDVSLFQEAFNIAYKINLTFYWKRTRDNPERRTYIWKMLKRLVVYAGIVVEPTKEILVAQDKVEEDNFNVIDGVQATEQLETLDTVTQQIDNIPYDREMLINKAMEMAGFKYNADELKNQIKNVNEDQLNQIPNMLQQMLGTQGDQELNNVLSVMTHDVGNVLKNTDVTKGNLFDNITGVAKQMIDKYANDDDGQHLQLEKLAVPMMAMMEKMGIPKNMKDMDSSKLMTLMAKMAFGMPKN